MQTLETIGSVEHAQQLWQARFSRCGKFLVAAGYGQTIERWRVEGAELSPMPAIAGHNGWVQCFAFYPDGERLVTADSWGRLACWHFQEESPQPVWSRDDAHPSWIRAIDISPDGKLLATAGNGPTVKLWNADDGMPAGELAEHAEKLYSVRFHPDGVSLATGDMLAVIRHWNVPEKNLVRQFEAPGLYQLHNIQQCGGARTLAFDQPGALLAVGGQKTPTGGFATGLPAVMVLDWASGELRREMQIGGTEDGFVYDAQFHPDGYVMATSCAFPGKGHVWFWRPEEEKAFYVSDALPNGRSLSLHPDGRLAMLVSHSPNGNGRALTDGEYPDGSSKILLLKQVG